MIYPNNPYADPANNRTLGELERNPYLIDRYPYGLAESLYHEVYESFFFFRNRGDRTEFRVRMLNLNEFRDPEHAFVIRTFEVAPDA